MDGQEGPQPSAQEAVGQPAADLEVRQRDEQSLEQWRDLFAGANATIQSSKDMLRGHLIGRYPNILKNGLGQIQAVLGTAASTGFVA